ncbi:MAG: hypothetical protein MPW16_14295 [Candidatus Manganitrophus sp.]|nr:MAG: hypothetical protein MPW16_14295 [Candidatus Manganitrophus sp.]
MIPLRRIEEGEKQAVRGIGLALIGLLLLLPIRAAAEEPISLEILFDGVPAPGGGWVLTVTLLARTDLDLTHLTVVSSKGLERTAGDPHWQGTLPAGGEQVLELSFTLTDPPPQSVTIRAQGRTKKGSPFEKKVVRGIN